jgi:NADH-quinone oxidoreductase subunit M
MILLVYLALPFVVALFSYLAERQGHGQAKIISLIGSIILLGFSIFFGLGKLTEGNFSVSLPWIPALGVRITLAVDGLSFLLLSLNALLALSAILISWNSVTEKAGPFYLCLNAIVGGTVGVFLAQDLFLFYFFWEMMLIPMYFLIGIWGHENRIYAAIKFFLFTFISGVFLLASLIAIYWIHGQQTGVYTFDYQALLDTSLTATQQAWIFGGFMIGFAVKLPAFGVHTWLPDAHTEAPTAGSILLAGILLKTGAYGLIRFAWPFCPAAAQEYGFVIAVIGSIGIFYGAILAMSQSDLKRLVAYSSVSHMGFVLVALAAGNTLGGQGAVMQMICHGLSTGALFAVVGMIDERYHTRRMDKLGGLWTNLPRLSGFVAFFAVASLGIPGLGNFIAELLVLMGAFKVWPVLASVASIGLLFGAFYSLKIIQKTVYGKIAEHIAYKTDVQDLNLREWIILAPLAALLVWFGLNPGTVLKFTHSLWEITP